MEEIQNIDEYLVSKIKEVKQLRVDGNAFLERLKELTPKSRHTSLAITNMENVIFRLGAQLGHLNNNTPYPESFNPNNAIVHPTADKEESKMDVINKFKGKYAWLSNFQSVEVVYRGLKYPSVEHAYQSAKSMNPKWQQYCLDTRNSAGDVKRKAKDEKLRIDWEEVKVGIMYDLVFQKFNQEPFRQKLLDTIGMKIVEGNRWGDTFLGCRFEDGRR